VTTTLHPRLRTFFILGENVVGFAYFDHNCDLFQLELVVFEVVLDLLPRVGVELP